MIAKVFSSSILNLGLRGFSMLAKFLLIIYIGKYLSIDDLGEYGLFVTTITIAIYFLGLDFYTYNTREMLAKGEDERLPLIRDQLIFHLIVYVGVLPLLLSIFTMGVIEIKYMVYFYLILVFEHLSQELFRLYTTLQKPIFANMLLFFRTGLWIYVVIALWYLNIPSIQNLETVWYAWAMGSFISIAIGVTDLHKSYDFKSLTEKVNWLWIKNGVKVSIPFFIGTLAYKVIEFSDRYMIDYYMTKKDVGIYTFFGSIANTIFTVVFTLVIMIYYPKLISAYQTKQDYKALIRPFFYKTILISLISSVLILIFINPILDFMNKEEFKSSIEVLWILILATIVLNISFVPHYVLYAMKLDVSIRDITIVGALINIIINIFLIKEYGLIGASVSTLIAFTFISIAKGIRVLK